MNKRTYSFRVWFCENPRCGIHIIAFDDNENIMAETVMSPEQTMVMVNECILEMYNKSVEINEGLKNGQCDTNHSDHRE